MNTEIKLQPSRCKFCEAPLKERFIDIVLSEGVNQSNEQGSSHSLPTYVCTECFLVQQESVMHSNQEQDYVSSFSSSCLKDINQHIDMRFNRFELTDQNLMVELSGHQDHLSGQPVLSFGNKGLNELIDMRGKADLLICKDALAYTHDINDFVSAIKLFLKPDGTVTLEFLHILSLTERSQFEVLFSERIIPYASFTTMDNILKHHGLAVFDIKECLPKGSIKIYAKHRENTAQRISITVPALRGLERDKGMFSLTYYKDYKNKAIAINTVN